MNTNDSTTATATTTRHNTTENDDMKITEAQRTRSNNADHNFSLPMNTAQRAAMARLKHGTKTRFEVATWPAAEASRIFMGNAPLDGYTLDADNHYVYTVLHVDGSVNRAHHVADDDK
jgi:hypothetical protein